MKLTDLPTLDAALSSVSDIIDAMCRTGISETIRPFLRSRLITLQRALTPATNKTSLQTPNSRRFFNSSRGFTSKPSPLKTSPAYRSSPACARNVVSGHPDTITSPKSKGLVVHTHPDTQETATQHPTDFLRRLIILCTGYLLAGLVVMKTYPSLAGKTLPRLWCSKTTADAYVACIQYAVDNEKLPWRQVMDEEAHERRYWKAKLKPWCVLHPGRPHATLLTTSPSKTARTTIRHPTRKQAPAPRVSPTRLPRRQ